MAEMNFRKSALTKQGNFSPAKKNCTVVQPTSKKPAPKKQVKK